MEDLRIVLIIVGALAIGALLIHGLWSIRKQNQAKITERPMRGLSSDETSTPELPEQDAEGFDRDGIGKVRVVSGPAKNVPAAEPPHEKREPVISVTPADDPEPVRREPIINPVEPPQSQPVMEQTELFAPAEDGPEIKAPKQEKKRAYKSKSATARKSRKEPEVKVEAPAEEPAAPELVLVLNVQATAGGSLPGAAMLPALLTLGFKYGEMSIFHRHEDSAGTGAVLFSLVNMVKPGTFDLDSMETFSTPGISMFMALPGKGEAQKTFTMMLDAAEQLANELGGQVTDEQRNVLTKQKIGHYQERIREFERKRLVTN